MKSNNKFYLIVFIFFAAGLLAGWFWPQLFTQIGFLGTIYVNLLKMIVIPILFCEIMVGVYNSVSSATKITLKTVGLFIVMFAVSFAITGVMVALLAPGAGFAGADAVWEGDLSNATVASFFTSILPANIIAAAANNEIFPCILFAFVCGVAASRVQGEKAIAVVASFGDIFRKVLEYIMWLTPLGVFALIGSTVATYGVSILGSAIIYIAVAYGGCLMIAILVMILPVWIYARISPLVYVKNVCRIWLITLSTCSSAATLPNTIRICNENFCIPARITSIVVPLGCTIHMCGGAVSFCLLAMFSMQMAGIPLTVGLLLKMFVIALVMNMAAPGIPGGGIVLGATYLATLGLPTTFIGVYSGIYRLLDMAYTSMNVTGDISANIIIAHSEQRQQSGQTE